MTILRWALGVASLVGGVAATWAAEPATVTPPPIVWTAQEAAYLERVRSIKMCVDPDWTPFERINAQGQHEGIAADLVQLVASRVGLHIELYPVKNWDESLQASKAGHCQIMSFLNQTPVRDRWLLFTRPLFSDQNIIITREEHPYIGEPHELTGKTVALPRGTMVEERMRASFPDLRVITTASEADAVTLVAERKADMTVRSLIVAAYTIKQEGLFNLKISGQIPEFTNQLRIGVIKSEPVLRGILDKGVQTISAQDREAIVNEHVPIQVQKGLDYTLLWQITLGAALVLGMMVYWNRKRRVLNTQLEHLSVTDRLTGLFNRNKIDAEFESELQRSMRFGLPFSLILLDLDHFKQVNDTHGHPVGDQVLQGLAQVLRANTRETDVVGRWGGEEFMVICPHTDAAGARAMADNLRRLIAAHPFPSIGTQTASLGVTSYRPGDSQADMVARADEALYAAKQAGRNRVEQC